MKNLIKYIYYTLLTVAFFIAHWLLFGFVKMDFDIIMWPNVERILVILFTILLLLPVMDESNKE